MKKLYSILPLLLALALLASCGTTTPAPTPTDGAIADITMTPTPEPTMEPLAELSDVTMATIGLGADNAPTADTGEENLDVLVAAYRALDPAEEFARFPEQTGTMLTIEFSGEEVVSFSVSAEHPEYFSVKSDRERFFRSDGPCADTDELLDIYADSMKLARTDEEIASALAKVRGIAEELECEVFDRVWYDPAVDAIVTGRLFEGDFPIKGEPENCITVLYFGTWIQPNYNEYTMEETPWVCWNGSPMEICVEILSFTRSSPDSPWDNCVYFGNGEVEYEAISVLFERNSDGIVEG